MSLSVRCLDAHAGGGLVRLLVGGAPPLPGETLAERGRYLVERHTSLWQPLIRPPRAPAGAVLALLAAPADPAAHLGVLFVHADGSRRPTGAGLVAAITLALERQLATVRGLGPATGGLRVETETGPVSARVRVEASPRGERLRVASVAYVVPAVRVLAPGWPASLGSRRVRADLVRAGGLYAVVDAEAAGVPLAGVHLSDLGRAALALTEQIENAPATGWPDVEGVVFTGPPEGAADLRAFTVGRDGTLEPGPSGGAAAALLAVLHAMGLTTGGGRLVLEGPSGVCAKVRIEPSPNPVAAGGIEVAVETSAWLIGESTLFVAADDPLPGGVRS